MSGGGGARSMATSGKRTGGSTAESLGTLPPLPPVAASSFSMPPLPPMPPVSPLPPLASPSPLSAARLAAYFGPQDINKTEKAKPHRHARRAWVLLDGGMDLSSHTPTTERARSFALR